MQFAVDSAATLIRMRPHSFDPRCLDVATGATQGDSFEGDWPLAAMPRLKESAHEASLPGPDERVRWQARCESRPVRAADPQVWLHLDADTAMSLVCQRCLQPVRAELHAQRSFLFVRGEDAAAQLDADSEDDVLALTRTLDLIELVEDELLLSLPLVPRHDVCPQPLSVKAGAEAVEDDVHPFAGLSVLKRGAAS